MNSFFENKNKKLFILSMWKLTLGYGSGGCMITKTIYC
jgi:hypothetical protein